LIEKHCLIDYILAAMLLSSNSTGVCSAQSFRRSEKS